MGELLVSGRVNFAKVSFLPLKTAESSKFFGPLLRVTTAPPIRSQPPTLLCRGRLNGNGANIMGMTWRFQLARGWKEARLQPGGVSKCHLVEKKHIMANQPTPPNVPPEK